MNKKAMYKLSYGLFVLTAKENAKNNGCIINTAIQAASTPNQISVCVNKANYTHDMILRTGAFNVSIISQNASFDLFKHFGFQSGKDVDKFESFGKYAEASNGIYYVTEGTNAYISVKVEKTEDLGSHTMFIGEVTDMEVLSDESSVTYDYYMSNIKPKPQAVAETPDGKTVWRCTICGYEYVGDVLPEDYVCPLCKHPASDFEKVTPAAKASSANTNSTVKIQEEVKMAKYVCSVCGYVHEGDSAPAECPVCHVPAEKFVKQEEGEIVYAAEHVVGVAKGSPEDIIADLRANFEGECSEVGMYLAMARVAHREGYPEIGLYWEKAAYEEAEHAAKFAELLGEVVTDSTKKNLEMRVAAEHGATAGKTDLAKRAKALNLDAIHDTVHEMARDEARHGKALAGLLKRYFG